MASWTTPRTVYFYKMVNDVDGEVYIGHTANTLKKRLSGHRASVKIGSKTLVHKHMRDIGVDHFSLELLIECISPTKRAACKGERWWIENHPGTLNSDRPYVTKDEGRRLEREWQIDPVRGKRACKCSCGGRYTFRNKTHHENSQKHQKWIEQNIVDWM